MEARLVGYDEIPLSPASSSASTNVENLGFGDHSTAVNSDFNFSKLSLEDCPLVDEDAEGSRESTDLSCLDKKSPRTASLFFKRTQHSEPIGDEICDIDSDAQGIVRTVSMTTFIRSSVYQIVLLLIFNTRCFTQISEVATK